MEPIADPQFRHRIEAQILEDGTLEIPRAFMKKHGRSLKYLHKYACLEVATGRTWKVEMRTVGDRVWLDRGWQAFVENCSIKCDYDLVFRYQGGSFFQVTIFDISGLEIAYPTVTGRRLVVNVKQEESDDDSSVVILDKWPLQSTAEASAVNLSNEDDEVIQGFQGEGSSARDGVLHKARNFRSSGAHFFVIMPQNCDSELVIPGSAESFFQGGDGESMFVNGPDDQSTYMKYRTEGSPVSQIIVYYNWSEFAKKYRLKDGDACIFELIMVNTSITAFNTTIFHIDEGEGEGEGCREGEGERDGDGYGGEGYGDEDREGEEGEGEGFNMNDAEPLPSFTVVHTGTTHSSFTLIVPPDHASRYLSDQHKKEVFLHGLAGKTWPLTCYAHRSNVRFQSSKDFVRDNDLQKGDTCVFELFSEAPNRYNVTIHRAG